MWLFWQHPMSYKPLILLDFFILPISLLYIELKVPQGTGRILRNPLKISTLTIKKSVRLSSPKDYCLFFLMLSLRNCFRRVFRFRQVEQTKNEDIGCSTWTSNCTHRTASPIVLRDKLTLYKVTF